MNKVFEKIIEKQEELFQDLNVIEVLSHVDFDSTIQNSLENFLKAITNEAIEIVKQEAEKYNNGWIPCSERLPEKNGMYLCTQNTYDLATNKKIIRVSTELVEFYDGKWRRAKNLVVTHWQSLPEPFKERD